MRTNHQMLLFMGIEFKKIVRNWPLYGLLGLILFFSAYTDPQFDLVTVSAAINLAIAAIGIGLWESNRVDQKSAEVLFSTPIETKSYFLAKYAVYCLSAACVIIAFWAVMRPFMNNSYTNYWIENTNWIDNINDPPVRYYDSNHYPIHTMLKTWFSACVIYAMLLFFYKKPAISLGILAFYVFFYLFLDGWVTYNFGYALIDRKYILLTWVYSIPPLTNNFMFSLPEWHWLLPTYGFVAAILSLRMWLDTRNGGSERYSYHPQRFWWISVTSWGLTGIGYVLFVRFVLWNTVNYFFIGI